MDGPLGLTLLAKGASSADRGVDIVAVHGVESHACWKTRATEHSSSQNGTQAAFWLRDWLPSDLPSARIFTYGYHLPALCEGGSFEDAADKLLGALKRSRADKSEEPRPLLFICHSLGGLVVKCALIKAYRNRGDERLNQISTATQGVIFLGTPHSTRSSELHTSVARITVSSGQTEVTMVAIQAIQQVLIQFASLPWSSLPWSIVSFYEELPLPGSNFRAVDRNQTELWTFPQVSLHSHHHDMCRFTSDDDLSYLKILESLRNISLGSNGTDKITVHPTLSRAEHEVLQSLAVEDVSPHIRDASQGTCNWILEHDAFKSWSQEKPSQMLWVRGKAGTGKTTLMKYIYDSRQSTVDSTQVAYFFFFRRGTNSSLTSLLRSLLYQLLKLTFNSRTSEVFAKLIEEREILGSDGPWDDDMLTENLLGSIDKSTALGYSFSFYIDALDECNDPDKAISFFRRLNSPKRRGIRTCLSSRHSPSFTPAWEIRMEDNNFFDIQRYLDEKLLIWQDSFPSASDVKNLVPTITKKAQGVFLWAALVVSALLRDSFLKPFKTVQDSTWWLPTDLEAAYSTVLRQIWNSPGERRRRTAQDALILVMYAKRPLSILELREAVAGNGLDHQEASWTQGQRTKLEDIRETQETLPPDPTAQLMILCGGLLEVSSQLPRPANGTMSLSGLTVKFIHQTVREYLLGKGSSEIAETPKGGDRRGDFHFRVAWICLNYINGTVTSSQISIANKADSSSHFLGYAVIHGMQHLSLAAQMGVKLKPGDVWQSPPVQDGFIDHWVYLHNQYFGNQNLFKPRRTKAAHVMSYFGLPWPDTELWGASLADINEPDHHGQTPLSFAAAMGHHGLCRTLAELGADVNHRDYVYGQTPLSLAASHGHRDVVEVLLRVGSDSDDHKSGVSALWMAADSDHLQVVQLLLEAGANARTINVHTGETALSRAAAHGHIPIVSLLLESGAEVESWDKRGWTPLHHAVSRSRKKTLELLLGILRQDQLHTLRLGLAKAKSSWIDAVLRAMILGLCFHQCGHSQIPPSESSQSSKTRNVPGHNRISVESNRKRGRQQLDWDSDEDDHGEDKSTSAKRARPTNPDGRRFACPYHKKNAMKYPDGACNGKGFENIHRLKSHLKKTHSRVLDWQRCHICQARFRHDKIAGHEPCVKREQPTDYEDGFDAVQLKKLESKEIFPRGCSEELCWYSIYRVLFPDWPKAEEIPSPYQEEHDQTVQSQRLHCVGVTGDILMSSDTISEMMNWSGHGQGEQGLRQIFDRLLGDLKRQLGLPSTTEGEEPYRGSAPESLMVSQLSPGNHPRPRPATNATSSAAPPQQAPTHPNTGEAQVEAPRRPMEMDQGSDQYLRVSESLFQRNYRHGYDSFSDLHTGAMASSDADSSFLNLTYNDPEMLTHDTAFSDFEPIDHAVNHAEWEAINSSGSLLSSSQQMAGSIPQLPTFPRSDSNLDHTPGTMFLTSNQDNTSRYAGSGVPAGPQQQQGARQMGSGQNITTQFAEPLPGGDDDKQGSITSPYQADEYDHGSASQS